MNDKNVADKLLNLPYAGCVGHWAHLIDGGANLFEACGRYQRRTFRNRTVIMAANGQLAISIPLESDYSKLYRDIRINYDTNWAQQHMRALTSSYNSTPFFEYYADDFEALYNKNHKFAWDFNLELMELIASLIGVKLKCNFTTEYCKCPESAIDFRAAIEPKHQNLLTQNLNIVEYYQVFGTKFGFAAGLSIFDMLFNVGPESLLLLRKMNVK